MGLPKGAKQVVLAHVEIVANDRQRLRDITPAEVAAEGFPEMSVDEFITFWMREHGVHFGMMGSPGAVSRDFAVRRIRWRFLD